MKSSSSAAAAAEDRAIESADLANALATGTMLVELMRLGRARPSTRNDVHQAPIADIECSATTVRIAATARTSDVANHPAVAKQLPMLAEAMIAGAAPQIRDAATVAGNLVQRTRCPYFRELATACNKREPGTGCSALHGYTRSHAVLGTSPDCIATHSSDLAVALVALEAIVHTRSPAGARALPIADLYTLPGSRPDIETVLAPDETITHVEVPITSWARRSTYLKVRDRTSYTSALAAAAVALEVTDDRVTGARIALGGIATKPWRSHQAERELIGKRPTTDVFLEAAQAALAGARPLHDNAFKIELARRTIVRALERVADRGSM
ncbi:MAG: xanthine dehydrogenase family protein subunit M [Kofleriaceae bacterium]